MWSRQFTALCTAQLLSSLGDYFFSATVTVWVVTRLASPGQAAAFVAAIVVATALPQLLLGPAAGVAVDRSRAKRLVMVRADLVRAGMLGAFLVLLGLHASHAVLLAAIVCVVAGLNATGCWFDAARAVLMQSTVAQENRSRAAGVSMIAVTTSAVSAGAAGAAIFGWFGPTPAVVLDAATFLVSAALAATVGEPDIDGTYETAAVGRWRAFGEAVAHARTDARLRLVAASTAVYATSVGINSVALSLFALETLKLTPERYGAVLAAFPAGNLLAALTVHGLIDRLGRVRSFVLSLLALGVANGAYAQSRGFVMAIALMFVSGILFAGYQMSLGPVVQDVTPPAMMGRMSALIGPLGAMSSLLGTGFAAAGLHAHLAGSWVAPPRALLTLSAALLVCGGLVLLAARGRERAVS